MATSSSTSTAKSAKTAKQGRGPAEAAKTKSIPKARRLSPKRLSVAGAALLVAGGAAYGIDQAVSPSSASTKPRVPPAGAPAREGAIPNIYLAVAPNAVVEVDLVPAATKGYTGTATTLAQLGPATSRSDVAQSYSISATLHGEKLDIGFNGAAKMPSTLKNGSFTVEFPIPYGNPEQLTFNQSNVQAVAAAQDAFKAKLASNPGA